MAEVLEAPVEQVTPKVDNTPDILDTLAAKSEAKIAENKKHSESRNAPSLTPETVSTLDKSLEVVADDKPKDSTLSAEEQAKAQIALNEQKIADEKAAAAKAGADAKPVDEVKIEKNHWEEETNTPESKKDDEKGSKALADKYESQAKEYENLLAEPLISSYLAAKKAGKDVGTFINEVNGENIKALTDDQVWEKELRSASLSDEDIKAEMERFKDMGPYQRKKEIEPIRSKFEGQQAEKLKKYASDNTVSAQKNEKIAQLILQEKEQYLNNKKGKVEMGLEMTPARLQEISEYIDTFSLQRSDGSVDVARIARIGMLEKNSKLLLQNAYNKGANDEKIRSLKEIARPSREDASMRVIPDQRSAAKKDVEAFRNEIHD